jgi:Fe-S-cluster-containing dehydrogenase component
VLSESQRRHASVRAKTLVEALWLPAPAVRELLARHKEVEQELRAQLARRAGPAAAAAAAEEHRGTVMFLIDQTGAFEATDLLVIDESLCIRCDNCEKACAGTHGGISRLDREAGPTYQSSSGAQLHLPTACQHCENPKCMDDCPPDALHRDPNGEVYVRDNCIGCGNCVRNCPYGVIQMAAVEKHRPKGVLWRLLFGESVEEATGDKKAVKCDLCMELPEPVGGRKKAACVASCPTGAIVRADPRKLVDEIIERV